MSYSDYEFYIEEFKGNLIPEGAFDSTIAKASRLIDKATSYQIGDLIEWPEFTQRQVKLAECAQAEFTHQYGEMDEFLNSVGSYSIGDVSVSAGKANETRPQLVKHYGICDEAISLLMPTGLLDRRLR